MKTRHHVAIQMEEEQQWVKDNGPIVKTADQLWRYSGEIEEDKIDIPTTIIKLTKYEIYKLFNKGTTKRGRAINCHLTNPSLSITDMSKKLRMAKDTVKDALSDYYEHIKNVKHKINSHNIL